jgi:hypothetical protein
MIMEEAWKNGADEEGGRWRWKVGLKREVSPSYRRLMREGRGEERHDGGASGRSRCEE